MPEDRRAVFARSTVGVVESEFGPDLPHYVLPLDLGEIFRWVPGSELVPDGVAVLGYQGGSPGAWVRVRRPDQGDDLTDADVTITIGQGGWRRLPAATLSANRTATLAITNAAAGDILDLTRLDVGAFTFALVNGGPGAGTLCTFPVSARAWARLYFDGDNWLHRASALML